MYSDYIASRNLPYQILPSNDASILFILSC